MSLLRKVSGLGTALTVWRAVHPGLIHPSGTWFGRRFMVAATVVVDRWGPAWAKRRLANHASIGACLFFGAWIIGAALLVRHLW